MAKVLNRKVFVLNRNWQLVNETTVLEALKQMYADVATALAFDENGDYEPVRWDEWIKLPLLKTDEAVHTTKIVIRMPTVIVAVNYDRLPKRKPKLTTKNIVKRDKGICQHTGKLLQPHEYSLDHVDPLSRGGLNVPENIVLCDKAFNTWKGNKTCEELGIPRPKVKKLGAFRPDPSHPHHEKFKI
jgi:5-methylcytosine-specific restriction endonuclease McrA